MSEQTAEPANGAAPPDAPGAAVQTVSVLYPQDNIMLHGYRELSETQAQQLRELKDSGLALWNDLHMIDGSSAERRTFDNRELGFAAQKLEEMMLWVEKHFAL